MNEATVRKKFYFQWRNLNVYKTDVVMYFSELVCQFLLFGFRVGVSKISDKTVRFVLNYNNLFWGPLLIRS